MVNVRILVPNPVTLTTVAAQHLCPKGPTVPVPLDTNNSATAFTLPLAIHPHQFECRFGRLGACRKKEGLVERITSKGDQPLKVTSPQLAAIGVTTLERSVQCITDCGDYPRVRVADVGNKDGGCEVDEPVPPCIEDAEVLRPVPDQRQLAMHGSGLHNVQPVENLTGARRRDVSPDTSVLGHKAWHRLRIPREGHGC